MVRNLTGTTDFSLLQNIQPPIQWLPGLLLKDKATGGSELDLSRPSSAEVKNDWLCTSTPHICCHGLDRNEFTFMLAKLVSQRRRLLQNDTFL